MFSLVRNSRILVGFLTVAALAGCGGRYNRSGSTSPSVSPFAGTYVGNGSSSGFTPYNFSTSTTQITEVVHDDGTFTGTVTDSNDSTPSPFLNVPGTVSGTIQNNGTVSGTISFAGHNLITFSGTITGGNGTVSGTLPAVFTPMAPGATLQNGTFSFNLSND